MNETTTSNFKRLIGIWKTEGTILNGTDPLRLTGTDSYEFILDGNYILHKADVLMGNQKSQTYEIISLGSSPEKAIMHYYNSEGESGVMAAFLQGAVFRMEGDKIKFEGTIDVQNTKVAGKWSVQGESEQWTDFIDLTLTKQR